MQAPDYPENEQSRIETLHALNILDTASEKRFDRVTRLAARLFQVPIALVSLVDENRQWFKSCIGLDARETPRDISFCGHAILGDETFYIEDTTLDGRFSDNPLVTGPPFIRFYAGHPIKAPNGEKMGTLCIIDSAPKLLDQADLSALEDLAAMVERELTALELSTRDELTNIPNRRGFLQLAQHSLSVSRRYDTRVVMAYLDLNAFKPINDLHGHREGDRALKLFAAKMKETFRGSDVFGRIGGDEFAVLYPNTGIDIAEDVMARFSSGLEQLAAEKQLEYKLSFSCGLVEFDPDKHESIESLIDSADQAMYKNRKSR